MNTRPQDLVESSLHCMFSHIQAAIVCGQAHNMQMKIHNGGHEYEGIFYCSEISNFYIIDLFNLRSINVNILDETPWVQAGATLGEDYYRIVEKSSTHGYPAGVCPTVAVGGHISSGEYENLMRKYGHWSTAKIIDVNGSILDRKSMGEDFFWAINGGGGSIFGID